MTKPDADCVTAPAGAPLGVVLAGGLGSRLGGRKPTASLAGLPLIGHPLRALEEAGIEAVVAAKPDTELPPLDCGVVREPAEPRHPLCGVVAALRAFAGRPLIVVPCDMPLASASLLGKLARASEPLVLTQVGADLDPFPARVAPDLLPALEEALDQRASLREALRALGPRRLGRDELARFGDPAHLLLNVNDAADLRRARHLLGAE